MLMHLSASKNEYSLRLEEATSENLTFKLVLLMLIKCAKKYGALYYYTAVRMIQFFNLEGLNFFCKTEKI